MTARSLVGQIVTLARLRYVLWRVMRDPRNLDYVDAAIRPASEGDADTFLSATRTTETSQRRAERADAAKAAKAAQATKVDAAE